MKNIKLTEEQQNIVEAEGNLVVIANPGSGKTTTLAFKIAEIFKTQKPWKGVIAISYTNKASDELKQKVNTLTNDNGNSFFGTIDKFYISNIILPFFKSMYRVKTHIILNLKVESAKEIVGYDFANSSDDEILTKSIELLKKGILILEYISNLALFIMKKSKECREYLKARYSHVCIDEYQDCDEKKHDLFLSLVNTGIIGIAIGDPNQSIFAFAGSNSEYLVNLTSRNDFKTLFISLNRRNHKYIECYSLKFLNSNHKCDIPNTRDKRLHLRKINGKEKEISLWIDKNINTIMKTYGVKDYSKIAVLTLYGKTSDNISRFMKTPNRVFINTPLDESSLYTDIVFKYVLMYIFGNPNLYIETIIENHIYALNSGKIDKFIKFIKSCKKDFLLNNKVELERIFNEYKKIFKHEIFDENILSVINSNDYVNSYKPLNKNEISILTIHKSKGSEYKIVFILDQYKYIIPKHDFEQRKFASIDNDRNVHYVAITRAKEAVFFILGDKRDNSKGEEKEAIISEFLDENSYWGYLYNFRTNK